MKKFLKKYFPAIFKYEPGQEEDYDWLMIISFAMLIIVAFIIVTVFA